MMSCNEKKNERRTLRRQFLFEQETTESSIFFCFHSLFSLFDSPIVSFTMAPSKNTQPSSRLQPKRKGSRTVAKTAQNDNFRPQSTGPRNRKKDIIDRCLAEIEALPVNPACNRVYRGSSQKIIEEYLELNHWLTKDMIWSKRKRRRKKVHSEKKSPPNQNTKRLALDQLTPVAKSGRPLGTTHAAINESNRNFAAMKNNITVGWADKNKRPKCTMKEWIHRNQIEYGFDTGKPEKETSLLVHSRSH